SVTGVQTCALPICAPGGVGSGRSRVHRKSGSPRVFQSEHVGGTQNVFAFHKRRKMLAGLAAERRRGDNCEAARTEKKNAENHHLHHKTPCRSRTREAIRLRGG